MEDLLNGNARDTTQPIQTPPKPVQFISLKSGKFEISPEAEDFFDRLEEVFASPNCK